MTPRRRRRRLGWGAAGGSGFIGGAAAIRERRAPPTERSKSPPFRRARGPAAGRGCVDRQSEDRRGEERARRRRPSAKVKTTRAEAEKRRSRVPSISVSLSEGRRRTSSSAPKGGTSRGRRRSVATSREDGRRARARGRVALRRRVRPPRRRRGSRPRRRTSSTATRLFRGFPTRRPRSARGRRGLVEAPRRGARRARRARGVPRARRRFGVPARAARRLGSEGVRASQPAAYDVIATKTSEFSPRVPKPRRDAPKDMNDAPSGDLALRVSGVAERSLGPMTWQARARRKVLERAARDGASERDTRVLAPRRGEHGEAENAGDPRKSPQRISHVIVSRGHRTRQSSSVTLEYRPLGHGAVGASTTSPPTSHHGDLTDQGPRGSDPARPRASNDTARPSYGTRRDPTVPDGTRWHPIDPRHGPDCATGTRTQRRKAPRPCANRHHSRTRRVLSSSSATARSSLLHRRSPPAGGPTRPITYPSSCCRFSSYAFARI